MFEIVIHRKSWQLVDMMYLIDKSKLCAQICLHKKACCTNLQLPIQFFVKLIISDMHHCITYMYINFQQNRVNGVVKPGAQIFAKNCKFHKFTSSNSIFFFNLLFNPI